jgi:hypothetical protein
MEYIVNDGFKIYCGFEVNGEHILSAVTQTNTILMDLPAQKTADLDAQTSRHAD